MLTAHIIPDVIRKTITGNTNGLIANNASKSNDGNFTRTASDIDDHVSHRLLDIYSYTYRSCHRLVNQINFLRTCMFSGISDGSFLNFGNSGWNTITIRRDG